MGKSRQQSMATIDAVLANVDSDFLARQSPEVQAAIQEELANADPTVQETTVTTESPNHPATPKAAPGTVASEQAKHIRARVAGQEDERDINESANFRVGPILDVFTSAWGKLGQFDLPGGIAVPLGVLLVLVLVLITVKGHTRLGWLWLAITGNAEIGGPIPQPTILAPTLTSIIGGSATLPTEPAPTSTAATKPAAKTGTTSTNAAILSGLAAGAVGSGPGATNGAISYSQEIRGSWLQEDL